MILSRILKINLSYLFSIQFIAAIENIRFEIYLPFFEFNHTEYISQGGSIPGIRDLLWQVAQNSAFADFRVFCSLLS